MYVINRIDVKSRDHDCADQHIRIEITNLRMEDFLFITTHCKHILRVRQRGYKKSKKEENTLETGKSSKWKE